MSRKLLCTLLVLVPSLVFAEQYKFSSFNRSKQRIPSKGINLPKTYYLSVSGSLLPDRFFNFYPAKNQQNSFLYELIHHQKGLISLNGGYTINKKSALELNLASSLSHYVISSLVYKHNHLYQTNKLAVSSKFGIIVPMAFEEERDNIPTSTIKPNDSVSSLETSSSAHGQSSHHNTKKAKKFSKRSKSSDQFVSKKGMGRRTVSTSEVSSSKPKNDSPSNTNQHPTASKQDLANDPQKITPAVRQYQCRDGFRLTTSLNVSYPLHPKAHVETSLHLILPLTDTFKGHYTLPFGMIAFIQVGVHVKLA